MPRLNLVTLSVSLGLALTAAAQQPLLTGQAAFTDYAQQQPGVRHKITLGDLPAPNPSEAVDNGPSVVPKPADAWPTAPAGFKVILYAGGDSTPMQRSENKRETHAATQGTFVMPRLIRFAPNGDLFLADSQAGTSSSCAASAPTARRRPIEKFATGLDHPVRHRLLPARAESAVGLRRQRDHDCALPVSLRRSPRDRRRADRHPGHPRLRAASRRRPLDARRRLHRRRQAHADQRRFGLQRRRRRYPSPRVPPRRRARVHTRRQIREGLRARYP